MLFIDNYIVLAIEENNTDKPSVNCPVMCNWERPCTETKADAECNPLWCGTGLESKHGPADLSGFQRPDLDGNR